jgi:hypothetical protein
MNVQPDLPGQLAASPTFARLRASVRDAHTGQRELAGALLPALAALAPSVWPGLAPEAALSWFAEHLLALACFGALPQADRWLAGEQNLLPLLEPARQIFAKNPENQAQLAEYRAWALDQRASTPADLHRAVLAQFFPGREAAPWPAGLGSLACRLAHQWLAASPVPGLAVGGALLPRGGAGLAHSLVTDWPGPAPLVFLNEAGVLDYWATFFQLAEAGLPTTRLCLTEPLLTDDVLPQTVSQGSLFAPRPENGQRLAAQNAKKFILIVDNITQSGRQPTSIGPERAFRDLDRRARPFLQPHALTGEAPDKLPGRYWAWLADRLSPGGVGVLLVEADWLTAPAYQAARAWLERRFSHFWLVGLAQLGWPGLALLGLRRASLK